MFLNKIVDYKKGKIIEDKRKISIEEMKDRAFNGNKALDFKASLMSSDFGIIAEVKKASPSKGLIRENYHPVDIAKEYENNAVAGISILTEDGFFEGKVEDFIEVRKAVDLPLLRKDFIIDPYQIYEAKVLGADLVLLIAALLQESELQEFSSLIHELSMQTLVEVHDESEIARSLKTKTDIFGINNRNLKTFHTDIKNTGKLLKFIPKDQLVISESGIHTREDMNYLESLGIQGVLIGESLMKSDSISQKIQELRG